MKRSKLIIITMFLCLVNLPAFTGNKIMGLTEIIMDLSLFVNDDYLKTVPGVKGSWEQISFEGLQKILSDHQDVKAHMRLGGSAANSIQGLAALGNTCGIIGKIGSDDKAAVCMETLHSRGIHTRLIPTSHPTSQCLILVTPDCERTMRTYLNATVDFTDLHLDSEYFEGASLVHSEVYLIPKPGVIERLYAAVKPTGAKISLALGSFTVVQAFRDRIWELLKNDVDIVFANEEEARALTSLEPDEACSLLAEFCEVAVVTMGEKGGFVQRGNEKVYYTAYPAKAIDTTGAGDMFVSGFLHGYLKEEPLETCCRYGAITAAHVVEVFGPELSEEHWNSILSIIGN